MSSSLPLPCPPARCPRPSAIPAGSLLAGQGKSCLLPREPCHSFIHCYRKKTQFMSPRSRVWKSFLLSDLAPTLWLGHCCPYAMAAADCSSLLSNAPQLQAEKREMGVGVAETWQQRGWGSLQSCLVPRPLLCFAGSSHLSAPPTNLASLDKFLGSQRTSL